jgi:hypothetical protein
MMDASSIAHEGLRQHVKEVAKQHHIDVQWDTTPGHLFDQTFLAYQMRLPRLLQWLSQVEWFVQPLSHMLQVSHTKDYVNMSKKSQNNIILMFNGILHLVAVQMQVDTLECI